MSKYPREVTLGILITEMTPRLPIVHEHFYHDFAQEAAQAGISVIIFSSQDIDTATTRVRGYRLHSRTKKWEQGLYPLPRIIYDRCFPANKYALRGYRLQKYKINASPGIYLLGQGLADKWNVMQLLQRDANLHLHVPRTEVLLNLNQLHSWLDQYPSLMIKPRNSSQGKGILYVARRDLQDVHYTLCGRTFTNQSIEHVFTSRSSLLAWLADIVTLRPYLIQQYCTLSNNAGNAYDIRALVQKNKYGKFQLTGMAIRQGLPGSITSNLHGGGIAKPLIPYLTEQFGSEQASRLQSSLMDCALRTAACIEQSYGRIAELGIDIGVDRDAHLWILEVNSKPGRSLFKQLQDESTYRMSIMNLIHYAAYLLQSPQHRCIPTARGNPIGG